MTRTSAYVCVWALLTAACALSWWSLGAWIIGAYDAARWTGLVAGTCVAVAFVVMYVDHLLRRR